MYRTKKISSRRKTILKGGGKKRNAKKEAKKEKKRKKAACNKDKKEKKTALANKAKERCSKLTLKKFKDKCKRSKAVKQFPRKLKCENKSENVTNYPKEMNKVLKTLKKYEDADKFCKGYYTKLKHEKTKKKFEKYCYTKFSKKKKKFNDYVTKNKQKYNKAFDLCGTVKYNNILKQKEEYKNCYRHCCDQSD